MSEGLDGTDSGASPALLTTGGDGALRLWVEVLPRPARLLPACCFVSRSVATLLLLYGSVSSLHTTGRETRCHCIAETAWKSMQGCIHVGKRVRVSQA